MPVNELPICTACGSHFDTDASSPPKHCKICDVSEHAEEKKGLQCLFAMLKILSLGSAPIRSGIGPVVDYAE